MGKYIILTIAYLASTSLWCQQMIWERSLGGNNEDIATDIIENSLGHLVVLGTTKSKTNKGIDISFNIIDPTYRSITESQYIGGKGHDFGHSILQSKDGSYLIAGASTTQWNGKSHGKSDAWLLQLDEYGHIITDTIVGTPSDDSFLDIVQTRQGYAICGYIGGFGVIYAINNNLKLHERIIKEEQYSKFTSITVDNEGNIIAVGRIGKSAPYKVFVSKLNDELEEEWSINLDRHQVIDVNDVDVWEDQYYVTTQIASSKRRNDAGIFVLSTAGELVNTIELGGRDSDAINSIIIKNSMIHGAGYSYSHSRGARRSNAWIQSSSLYEQKPYEPQFLGGVMRDGMNAIVELHKGGFACAGFTETIGSEDKDIWLTKFSPVSDRLRDMSNEVTIDSVWMIDTNNNDTLNFLERGYISMKISNHSSHPAAGLIIATGSSDEVYGVSAYDNVLVDPIPSNAMIEVTIPIRAEEYVYSGDNGMNLEIVDGDNVLATERFSFRSKAKPVPRLLITAMSYDTLSSNRLYQRKDSINIKYRIENHGEGIASDAVFRIHLPYKINAHNEDGQIRNIGRMLPGEVREVTFSISARRIFEFDRIYVGGTVYEPEYWSTDQKTMDIPIVNFYQDGFETNTMFKSKRKIIYENDYENKKGGPSFPDYSFQKNQSFLTWYAPDPIYGAKMVHHAEHINVQVDITATQSFISVKDVQLYVNGRKAIKNEDYDSSEEKVLTYPDNSDKFRYVNEVNLKEGINHIYIEVNIDGEIQKSKVRQVDCVLYKPNLYLYSVGVPHDGLGYTTKDAADIAALFNKNRLYDKTYIVLNNDSSSTHTLALKDLMHNMLSTITTAVNVQLENQSKNKKNIVILFISSHGSSEKRENKVEDFKIACSDIAENESRVLDFDSDILSKLENFGKNITSYVFIDACHSGIVGNIYKEASEEYRQNQIDLSDAVSKISNSYSDIYTIVSSGSSQLSYEDEQWENGAFTKALKEALKNEVIMTEDGLMVTDSNGDQKISVEELYETVVKRVPALIKNKDSEVRLKQTPYMPQHLVNSKTVIYDLRKE